MKSPLLAPLILSMSINGALSRRGTVMHANQATLLTHRRHTELGLCNEKFEMTLFLEQVVKGRIVRREALHKVVPTT
ncbi:hypothetical protein D3C72_2329770 [compost metagenome]